MTKRFYLKRDQGGRGLRSTRDVYAKAIIRVACYMCKSSKRHGGEITRKKLMQ